MSNTTTSRRSTWPGLVALAILLAGSVSAGATQRTLTKNVTGFAAKFKVKDATGADKFINVTGGAGGDVVTVSNAADLARQLCRSTWAGVCTDSDKRIIQVNGVIDLTDKQTVQADGCLTTVKHCDAPQTPEVTLIVDERERSRCNNLEVKKYDYYRSGVNGLLVGSNKTVIGLGRNSGLKGRGLLLQGKVNNIVIRNLAFTDINSGYVFGGDAIKLFDASGVWIDHNYFARIGRQMISTSASGTDLPASTDITISNNDFDGRSHYSSDEECSGKSYWGMLIAGTGRLTFVTNWLHDFGGRWPKLTADKHQAVAQVVNNLFENSSPRGSALQYSGAGLRVLAEGNYFGNVADPVANIDHHGAQLFGLYAQTTAVQNTCKASIGRICSGNIANPKDNDGTMVQDTAAIQAMQPYVYGLVTPYQAVDMPDTVKANAGRFDYVGVPATAAR